MWSFSSADDKLAFNGFKCNEQTDDDDEENGETYHEGRVAWINLNFVKTSKLRKH